MTVALLPRIIVTGASGFIGRHLLDALKDDFVIFGLARRSQARSCAPVHPNIHWFQADIAERDSLERIFLKIRESGGADVLIHLAAHYDFTGEKHPEYMRTNVYGLQNVLGLCPDLGLKRFVFSSSLAACDFPERGDVIDEASEPNGKHLYAETKAFGERVLGKFEQFFPSTIVRFAALFSDWCEYPPQFMMFNTWLSPAWNSRILGGKGETAIPYLHIRDVTTFMRIVIDRITDQDPGEVFNATVDGCVSHRELFEESTYHYYGSRRSPILMPKLLTWPGIRARCVAGKITGELPFERPWMFHYIDKQLRVTGKRTRERLGWSPRPRLEILRRLPFLLENFKIDPLQWNLRNRNAMRKVLLRPNLKIHRLIEKHEAEILWNFSRVLSGPDHTDRFPTYKIIPADQTEWNTRVVLRQLMSAIRTLERGVFRAYCRDLGRQRSEQGYNCNEVCAALEELDLWCLRFVAADPESEDVRDLLHFHISMTIRIGMDEVQDAFEEIEADRARRRSQRGAARPVAPAGAGVGVSSGSGRLAVDDPDNESHETVPDGG
jgi:nucleoside-diphosphate-sugar epimerase